MSSSFVLLFQASMLSKGDVDADTVRKIEEAYKKLNGPEASKCKSLLKKHLTKVCCL